LKVLHIEMINIWVIYYFGTPLILIYVTSNIEYDSNFGTRKI